MRRPRLTIKSTVETTRLFMTHLDEEILRATLPTPSTPVLQAMPLLCEALSIWLGRPLSVVVCAAAPADSSALGLCDGLGFGRETLYYQVDVLDPTRRRRGLGSFRDLRQLDLRGIR
jgi:hypothetical protein